MEGCCQWHWTHDTLSKVGKISKSNYIYYTKGSHNTAMCLGTSQTVPVTGSTVPRLTIDISFIFGRSCKTLVTKSSTFVLMGNNRKSRNDLIPSADHLW